MAERGAAPILSAHGISHFFDVGTPWEVAALRAADLDIYPGEGVVITGGNGSGKTTLAWILAGLLRPSTGTVTVDGAPSTPGAVALSFQHPRLQLQQPTVAKDILAAAGQHAILGRDADVVVAEALGRVGLSAELATRTIDELSGGQMRRVAIAGLLASRPRIMILDEPLAGLDRESRHELLTLLGRLRREEQLTLVIISHDFDDLGLVHTRTIRMRQGCTIPHDAAACPDPRRRRRRALNFRAIPGTSPLHRLDPAAKILILAAATVAAILLPNWAIIITLAVVLSLGAIAAHVPATAIPWPPWSVTVFVLVLGAFTATGGGLIPYVQSLCLTVLFLGLTLLLVWTTHVEALPAALRRLASPLSRLGAPVDEWVHSLALAVRTLPLLREELRILLAARSLRRQKPQSRGLRHVASGGREVLNLTVAILASASRRARDLGQAATQRGGNQTAATTPTPIRERRHE